MNNKKLLRAMGDIWDDLIAEAVIEKKPKSAGRAWLALAACLCILLTGAAVFSLLPKIPGDPHLGGEPSEPEVTTSPAEIDPTNDPDISVGEPYPSITLRSLAELAELRQMSVNQNETELQAYLKKLEGQGAENRQDLLDFLALVDSIPVVQLMDGTVTFLSHQEGYWVSSGQYYNKVDLTLKKTTDDWIRLEYMLSVEDLSAKVAEIKTFSGFTELSLDIVIEATGDRLRVYGEKRIPNATGNGGKIRWFLAINGLYTEVVYHTADLRTVDTAQIFAGLSVIRISDLRA